MTVTTTTNRNEYSGNGTQTTFPYTYKIFKDTDLQVYVNGVLQTLTTHYTVSGVGNATGGDVVFVTAPANGAKVLLLRVLPATQETSYPSNDKFPAKVHEDLADRAIMLIQQLQETDKRALKLAVSSLFTDLLVPDPEAGRFLRWNSLLTALENADVATLGALGLPVSISNGGSGANTALGARQGFGLDGQVRRQLTNRTGNALAEGDVVALSTANDSSVVLDDTAASKAQLAVCLESSLANLATGDFLLFSVADVKVTGTPARGQYLRKSNTTLALEDAGVTMGAAAKPPAGAIALAISSVASGKQRTIFFGQPASGGDPVNPVANQVFGG